MIRSPTIMSRSTVVQSFRCILTPVADGGLRKVQLMVPANSNVYALLAPSPQFVDEKGVPLADLAEAAGLDRLYKGMLLTQCAQTVFHLFPEQSLWAACEEGYAQLGIICEYLKESL
jgi:hypothetical protein